MTSFGFQLYSLHAVDDPLVTLIERVGETEFAGVEFAGLGDASGDAIGDALDRASLDAAGAHVGLDDIETDPDRVADVYRELGCEDIVVPWLDPEHFESADAVETAGNRLSAAADALAEYGLSLHYHNHDQEFVDLNGEPALVHLLDVTDDVGLQLDLGWAGAAGDDPLSFLDEHADRIDLVHLKDYDADAGETVEVGEGDLDIDAAVEMVRAHEFEWLIYEAEERPDSYETLSHADDILDSHW